MSNDLSDLILLNTESPDLIQFGYYSFLFIDLLAQGRALRKLSQLPETEQEHGEFFQAAKEAIGNTTRFRKLLKDFFIGVREWPLIEGAPEGLSDTDMEFLADLETPRLLLTGFSDTVLAAIRVSTDGERPFGRPSNQILTGAAGAMVIGLATGLVPRGAIDIGIGTEAWKGEYYGPALASCYSLESKYANWPRILVGSGLARFLSELDQPSGEPQLDAINRALKGLHLDILFEDCDGRLALDYLAPRLRDLFHEHDLTIIDRAQLQVERNVWAHRDDEAVGPKYRAVLRYFESRNGCLTEARRTAVVNAAQQGVEPG